MTACAIIAHHLHLVGDRSVLSIVGLVCPPLSGILMERAFPYVSLTDVIFQDVYAAHSHLLQSSSR